MGEAPVFRVEGVQSAGKRIGRVINAAAVEGEGEYLRI